MARASHSFFETISMYNTPEKIRETYQPALLVNKLAGFSDPVFDDLCIYYQIFLHAVIRDIRYGGLAGGFAQLLTSTQETLEHRYAAGIALSRKKAVREEAVREVPDDPENSKVNSEINSEEGQFDNGRTYRADRF